MTLAVAPLRRAICSPRLRAGLHAGIASALIGLPVLAHAQDAASGPSSTSQAPLGITEELIRLLIKHNALPREEAESLIRKMQQQTSAAKSGDVRVVYVPAAEKQKLQDEIQQNVLDTVKAEHWAAPNAVPEWLERIRFDGDLRVRYELDRLDSANSPFFINYQAINSGAPYDVNSTNNDLPPLLNTTQDRNMMRARARIGLTANVADNLTAGFSFATGNTNTPVSTNETLGRDFNKLSFVVDRAYFKYRPAEDWSMWLGRMPSPWLSTELTWDDDLGFDGLAVQFRHDAATLSPFVTVGAFPVENTAFDFPSNDVVKGASRNKWLYGAQLGTAWRFTQRTEARLGVAYYHFDKLEGEASSPLCPAFTSSVSCDTDPSRPVFLQPGNTLFALRNLAADPNNPNGPQFQYFGLASPFRILDVTAKLDIGVGETLRLRIDGAYVKNLAYDRQRVLDRIPVNNYDRNDELGGGSQGFLAQFAFGYPVIHELGEWSVLGGYRHLDSDAVVAAFTDSDFHLGGTNARGFFVGGSFGITRNTWVNARWLSATEVSGAPLANDVVQLDVNARF